MCPSPIPAQVETHHPFVCICIVLAQSVLLPFSISRLWLQADSEQIEDALLIGQRGGDDVEVDVGLAKRLAAEGGEMVENALERPLAPLAFTVCVEEWL